MKRGFLIILISLMVLFTACQKKPASIFKPKLSLISAVPLGNAPDFTLTSLDDKNLTLSNFLGKSSSF